MSIQQRRAQQMADEPVESRLLHSRGVIDPVVNLSFAGTEVLNHDESERRDEKRDDGCEEHAHVKLPPITPGTPSQIWDQPRTTPAKTPTAYRGFPDRLQVRRNEGAE